MSKKIGNFAELKFQLIAYEKGYIVSQPFGDNAQYDFIVDNSGILSRIQVRATAASTGNGYRISLGHGSRTKTPYTVKDIDFLVAYIIPIDSWYIIPVSKIEGKKSITFYPQKPKAPFNEYKNIWDMSSPAPRRRSNMRGGLYEDANGFQLRFGPITRRFKDKKSASKCLNAMREVHALSTFNR